MILVSARCESLSAELEKAGHVVRSWNPFDTIPGEAGVLVVEGLEEITQAETAHCHVLALLEGAEVAKLASVSREVTDFAIKPLREGELAARVARIVQGPTWRALALQRLLALAVERTSDIVEITDPKARFQFVSPSYERTLGVPRAEAIGKTPAQLVRSDQHPPEFWKQLDETVTRGETWTGTIVSRARDGRLVHLDSTITPIADKTGRITHHMGIKRDITERLAQQEALLAANRALEHARDAALAASRAKSEFLANMSHELRTPLNAIIGYSEMLMEEVPSSQTQTQQDLHRIRTAGGHLLSLIDDVLDISKIEADRIDLAPEHVPISALLDDVSTMIRPLAEKNGNTLKMRTDDGAERVFADRIRLRQILFNVLSNACKFTKEGTVTLSVRTFERNDRPAIEFRVDDTGIGLTKEQQNKLFQPFMQADSSTTRVYGGTGLGLAICKRLSEMMGGTISLESEAGQGTSVFLVLPATAPGTTARKLRSVPPGAPVVLVIDDEEASVELCRRTLEKRGFVAHAATDGPQGLEMAAKLRPHAILLDVKMPMMSGWDVLSALKLSEKTSDIPVIMLTVMPQEEVGRALGAVDYLVKPFEAEALIAALRRQLDRVKPRERPVG